jgi:hypothetical protein
MWRYAQAATLAACCERAGIAVPNYHGWVNEADTLGVKDEFLKYLHGQGRFKGKARLSGLVAPNFFIPSPGMMGRPKQQGDSPEQERGFRDAAAAVGSEEHIRDLAELPGFDKWFLDWAVRHGIRGTRASLLMETRGARGRPAGSTGTSPADGQPTGPAEPAARTRRAGRRRSADTAALYQFCYEGHVSGEKASVTKLRANARFGANTIRDVRYVRIYAKRWAQRNHLPLPQPRPAAGSAQQN